MINSAPIHFMIPFPICINNSIDKQINCTQGLKWNHNQIWHSVCAEQLLYHEQRTNFQIFQSLFTQRFSANCCYPITNFSDCPEDYKMINLQYLE